MIQQIRDRFFRLKLAYAAVFGDGELNPGQLIVMADLRKFCCVDKTTMTGSKSVDPVGMAILEGRRQVYLRINQMVSLPEDTIIRQGSIDNE